MNEQTIKEVKSLLGMFFNEIKSNSVTDFITWLDCRYEYQEQLQKEVRRLKNE